MTLKSKLIALLLFATLVPTPLGVVLSFEKSKQILTDSTLTALNVMADFKESEIFLYLERIKTRVIDYSSDGLIRDSLEKITQNPLDEKLRTSLTNHLIKNKISLDPAITTIDILDKNGRVIVSTESSRVGQGFADKHELAGTFSESNVLVLQEKDNLRMAIPLKTTRPPFSSIGLLVLRTSINPLKLVLSGQLTTKLGALSQLRGFGKSGETYLVGANKIMITDSRFVIDAQSKQIVDTEPVRKCLENREEITGHWTNYLGHKVVGSSMCIDFHSFRWVLLVEENENEAFSQITRLQMFLILISVIAILCLIPLMLFFSALLVRRLNNLNEAAKRLGSGDLSVRVSGKISNDEIGTLSKVFNQMANQIETRELELKESRYAAEAANRAKTIFLSNMSHDVRTPLNAMLGMAEILDDTSLSQEKRSSFLKTLRRSGEGLLEIINDILEISKIESGRELNERPLNLREMMAELLPLYLPRAGERGLDLSCRMDENVPSYIMADAVCLKRVLENLLGNALKFTEKGSILIHITEQNGRILFSVKDTGIGISQENLTDIFTDFFQVESSHSKRFQGSGLGLAISKRLVKLMGGEITVNSELNVGSVFMFSLPLKKVEMPQNEEKNKGLSRPEALGLAPLKILLVDDSEDNRTVVEVFLKSTPFKIDSVATGQDALSKVKLPENHYDVILMDLQMPILDGFEATKLIRQWEKQEKRRPMHIIALSASSMPEDIKKSLDSGCDQHLSKPIKKSVLIETLKSASLNVLS